MPDDNDSTTDCSAMAQISPPSSCGASLVADNATASQATNVEDCAPASATDEVIPLPLIEFHKFPLLPVEIQLEIFSLCIPRRVVQFRYHKNDKEEKQPLDGSATAPNLHLKANTLPAISSVCRIAHRATFFGAKAYVTELFDRKYTKGRKNEDGTVDNWPDHHFHAHVLFNQEVDCLFLNGGPEMVRYLPHPVATALSWPQFLHAPNGPYGLARDPKVSVAIPFEKFTCINNWDQETALRECLMSHDRCTVVGATVNLMMDPERRLSCGLFGMFGEEMHQMVCTYANIIALLILPTLTFANVIMMMQVNMEDRATIDRYENSINDLGHPRKSISELFNHRGEDARHPACIGTRCYGSMENYELWREYNTDKNDDWSPLRAKRRVLVMQRGIEYMWLKANGAFIEDNGDSGGEWPATKLVPCRFNSTKKNFEWDERHPLAITWAKRLPKFEFVILYVANEPGCGGVLDPHKLSSQSRLDGVMEAFWLAVRRHKS